MSIEDTLVRRQVFVQRFAGGEAARHQELLSSLYATISQRLSRDPTVFQANRLNDMRVMVNGMLNEGFRDLGFSIKESATEFAQAEAAFTQAGINLSSSAVLSTPTAEMIAQAVLVTGMDTPVGPGRLTLNEAIDQFIKNKSREVMTAINEGILLGDTTPQIVRRIEALGTERHRRQVEALVRTSTNHAASQARKVVIDQNSSLFKGEEWVATLDSRTTLICAGRDGREYPTGKGPYPPAHWNCRSVRVPVLKDEFAIDESGTMRASKGPEGGKQVTGQTKFDGWLRRQPASFQDEYFAQFPHGKEKARLFRNGKVPIDRFRNETGYNYTLEELKRLEPEAFGRSIPSDI